MFMSHLLSGWSLKAYISSLSRSDEVEQESHLRRCNFWFETIIGSQSASHSCGGKAAILENLKKNYVGHYCLPDQNTPAWERARA